MQRIHMDDLTGFLLSQSDEWTVLNLPAIAQFEENIPLGNGCTHRREFGEALSPEREPLHVLEALKLQIGSDAFSAQYQQEPTPPGGAMVKRHWVKRYQELPPESEQYLTLQSWDTASKGGPDNDWSVCTTWIVTRDLSTSCGAGSTTPRLRPPWRPSLSNGTRGASSSRTPAPEPRSFRNCEERSQGSSP